MKAENIPRMGDAAISYKVVFQMIKSRQAESPPFSSLRSEYKIFTHNLISRQLEGLENIVPCIQYGLY